MKLKLQEGGGGVTNATSCAWTSPLRLVTVTELEMLVPEITVTLNFSRVELLEARRDTVKPDSSSGKGVVPLSATATPLLVVLLLT